MAKVLPTVALSCVLLVLLAHASSAYRTIITTVEVDDSSRGGQSCRQEAERRDLSACKQYIRRSSYDVLAANPQEQQMRECCNQLNRVSDECQCEALKYVVERQIQQQQQQQGREETQRMRQRAQQIPSTCGISQCEIRSVFF